MMRLLLSSVFAVALAIGAPAPAHSAPPQPGGACDGAVDAACRERPCPPDELDCGMVFCVAWVAGECVLRTA